MPPLSIATNTLYADIFSPSTHVGTRLPINVITQVSLTRNPPTRLTGICANMEEEIIQASGHTESSDNEEDVGASNDSFSYTEHFKNTLKTANLMQARRTSRGVKSGLVYTYHENIGVLDTYDIFDLVMVNGYDMYELHILLFGKPVVRDRISILDRLSTVINVIQFREFYYDFCLAYVGSSGDKAQSTGLIISKCAKSLTFVKTSYKEPSSKRLITTLLDTVYLKMMTHTSFLPNNAVSWLFVLP